MKFRKLFSVLLVILGALSLGLFNQCKPDKKSTPCSPFQATPYSLVIPTGFPDPFIPADNPMSVEGINLGRHLFYEKQFSSDNSLSCGSCHLQDFGFSDIPINATSKGVSGIEGRRNSMPIFNLAWGEFFFWDGRTSSLEEQSLHPIKDPIELENTLEVVITRLKADTLYPPLFKAAFGSEEIDEDRIAKALAQFERTIISAYSRFDTIERLKIGTYTASEERGHEMFTRDVTKGGLIGGDCFHCHGINDTRYLLGAFGKDNQFLNNGLNETHSDIGRMEVTLSPSDEGKFKVPSARNLEFTRPYMHDGSIPTLDSLIEFYNQGGHPNSPNIDPNMKFAGAGRNWTGQQKADLKAFLQTMTDYTLISNPDFSDPFNP